MIGRQKTTTRNMSAAASDAMAMTSYTRMITKRAAIGAKRYPRTVRHPEF